ncbi:sensor histidine kinase [Blautia producta]|uniref:sensor histidine kinase n=1 Tax=Blautia producta TaxID=33035 RepID=UPI0031B5D390
MINKSLQTPSSIRKKMFWAMYILILALTVMVDGIVYFAYKGDIEEKVLSFSQGMVFEMAENISDSVRKLEENMMYKITDSDMFSYQNTTVEESSFSIETKMQNFAALMNSKEFPVDSVYLCDMQGKDFFYGSDNSVYRNKQDFSKSKTGEYVKRNFDKMLAKRGVTAWRRFEDQPEKISLMKTVVNQKTLVLEGILCVVIDDGYFNSLEDNSSISMAVYDERDELLYRDAGLQAAETVYSGKEIDGYLFTKADVAKKRWRLVGYIREETILESLGQLMNSLLVIEVLFLLFSSVLAARISKGMTANISALIENLKRINRGEEAEEICFKSNDETAYLCQKFNDMNRQLKESVEMMAVNRTQKERAEYNALVSQMNPHFLYNTLETISAMAKLKGQDEIVSVITKLSGLLRSILSGDDQEICVSDELEFISRYLELQQLISGSALEWDIDADEEIKKCGIPKLILQPLIENAIIHGADNLSGTLMIVVLVRKKGEMLTVEVCDNGSGMEQDMADKILSEEEPEILKRDRTHIGLKNIQKRIHYLYGENYGMDIESARGNGTVVRLYLPVLEEKRNVSDCDRG